eukprot:TRINITY_DN5326_c0_g1_i3.p1 TRINITY_DN5326_c0_g1~~TRINITY_DN5326_c0_g1_i3.p1  ORF type:complete len:1072 (+),score=143.65 TRINITY_DN5326_c0_g1_i3:133-3348(+)
MVSMTAFQCIIYACILVLISCASAQLHATDAAVLDDLAASIYGFSAVPRCSGSEIVCSGSPIQRVTEIRFLREGSPVLGTLPESIGNLTELVALEIRANQLNGTIPRSIGKLSKLVFLRLSDQPSLSGTLPVELGALLNLQYLRIFGTAINGTLPQELSNLTQLLELDLNINSLSGTIPVGMFGNLTKLIKVFLDENRLEGTVPDEFYNSTSLVEFYLSENVRLRGSIPPSLSSISSLRYLMLNTTSMTGCIALAAPVDLPFGEASCVSPTNATVCKCGAYCSSFTVVTDCPYCPPDNSCIGARLPIGADCVSQNQCNASFCTNGTCSIIPPVPNVAPVASPGSSNLSNSPSNAGGTIAAIVVVLVVAIALALLAAFFIRRYIRKKNKPSNVFDVYDREARATQQQPLMGALSVSSADFRIVQELGKGSQGSVYLATYSGEFVAVKQLNADAAESPDELEALLSEADVMASIRMNKNVVKLIGVCRDDAAPSILMEFCPRGSLSNYLRQRAGGLSEYELFKFAYGTVEGMIALARSGVVHRDLAARNVLLSEQLFPKVADFGFAGLLKEHGKDSKLGPVKWQSPEVLKEGKYTEKSDVWAFGCVLVELATSREPYDGFQGNLLDLIAAVRDQGYTPLSHLQKSNPLLMKRVPEWMLAVMQECFKAAADDRPQFLQIRLGMNRNARSLQTMYDDEVDDAETLLNRMQYAPTSGSLSTTADTSSAGSWTSGSVEGRPSVSSRQTREDVGVSGKRNKLLFEAMGAAGKVDLLCVERLGKLGSGSFGSVFLGQSKGAYLALKVLSVAGSETEALKEAQLMMNIQSHRNIIQLYGMISQDDQLTICMEFAPRGALESLVYTKSEQQKRNKRVADVNITEGLVFRWAVGIARGMAALAASKIVHRDLAVRNVLLDSALEPKISDFGLARTVLDPNQESNTQTDIGPIRWFAPECFDLKYSEKTDVWAYGCTLVEIITGEAPMAHLKLMDVVAAVRGGRSALEQFTAGGASHPLAKPWMVEVLKMCFAFDPKSRPSFAELVSHLESVGPTIQEIRDAEAEIQKRRDRRADVRSMRIKD